MFNNDQIVQAMLPAQQQIGLTIGVDLAASADITLRAAVLACDAMVGLVIGVLTETGVKKADGTALTLADFQAALNVVRGQSYTPVPPPTTR